MQITLKKIINHPRFNSAILFLILANSIIIGLQTVPSLSENVFLSIADKIFLYIFVVEILLKIIANKKFFFYDAWNIFDVFIILFSAVFTLSTFTIFRAFRLFRLFRATRALRYVRVMRFVPNSENLQKIVASISRAIPKIISTGFLLVLIFYIYAVLGVAIYGATQSVECTNYFGNLISAFKTLFQVMTGDSWASGVGSDLQEFHSSIWIYLISFYLITALTLLSVVTGVIVDSISSVSQEFKNGSLHYGKSNHILILGFNEIVLYILKQINSYIVDSNKLTKQKILILDAGDSDKNRMKVSDYLGEENCLSVTFFTGEIDEKENLEKCNVSNAKSILLVDDDESKIAKIILTLRSLWEETPTDAFFATVVNDENLFASLKKAFPPELEINKHIHILSGEKIISNVLAHSCRKSGFSGIFKELFTSEKNEIYVKDFPQKTNCSFKDAALSYQNSTLIGYLNSQGKVYLNPKDKNEKITNECKGIFLSETKDTIKFKLAKTQTENNVRTKRFEPFSDKHILFLGCNKYLKHILTELDNYVGENSNAYIVSSDDEQKIFKPEIESLTLKNLRCEFTKNIPQNTQVIVFLTNSLKNRNDADSEVLMNLLTLLNESEKSGVPKYRLLCEMQKIENQSVAPKNLEYIVGNRLTSQILSQISLDESLHKIYEELLTSAGSEFYMRNPKEYDIIDKTISARDLTNIIFSANEIFIGYKNGNDIHLNIPKDAQISLSEKADLIVLSNEK